MNPRENFAQSKTAFLEINKRLVGLKSMDLRGKKLFPYHKGLAYAYKIKRTETGVWVTHPEVGKKQEVVFDLPNYGALNYIGHTTAHAEVKAGMHIVPLLRIEGTGKRGLVVRFNADDEALMLLPDEPFLVEFKPEDVLFYDGDTVSVSKFFLPFTKRAERLFAEIERRISRGWNEDEKFYFDDTKAEMLILLKRAEKRLK